MVGITKDNVESMLTRLNAAYGSGGNVWATEAQWRKLLDHPHQGPVTMISFNKTRPSEESQQAGRDYWTNVVPLLRKRGVSYRFIGEFELTWQGTSDELDGVTILNFPSRFTIADLFLDPVYIEHHKLREKSLISAKSYIVHGVQMNPFLQDLISSNGDVFKLM